MSRRIVQTVFVAWSATAVHTLERHFLILTYHVERSVLNMNDLRCVAVIVYIIDIGVLGRVSWNSLIAVYLLLNNVNPVVYH